MHSNVIQVESVDGTSVSLLEKISLVDLSENMEVTKLRVEYTELTEKIGQGQKNSREVALYGNVRHDKIFQIC